MSRLSKTVTTFGLALIGLITTTVTAEALTLQKANQSALVSGYNNQVEQEVSQIISDVFTINLDLSRENFNYFELNQQYGDLIFQQNSEQEAFIVGDNNQIIQTITQIQVNLFEVFVNFPKIEEEAIINNNFIAQFLEKVSDLSWDNALVPVEQVSYQDIIIDGEGNQVTQQINQTALTVFSFNTTLKLTPSLTEVVQNSFARSLKIDELNQITQKVNQTWIELFIFGVDNLSLDQLIKLASQSPGSDINPAEIIPTIPESTSVISLLVIGTMAIFLKIYH